MSYNSSVRIEQFKTNGSEMLRNMRSMEEFCDVTIISEENDRVKAHKVVLASASTLFRDLFQSENEGDYQVILMRGVS